MSDDVKLRVAKALTRWMNSECKPELAEWDALPKEIQDAYLDQADAAIKELRIADYEALPTWKTVAKDLEMLPIDNGVLYRTRAYAGNGNYNMSLTFAPGSKYYPGGG